MIKQKKIGMNMLLIYLLAFLSILSPNIYLKKLPYVRLEHIVLICAIIYLLNKRIFKKKYDMKTLIFPILLIVFGLIMIISTINGDINRYKVVINDVFELYKILIYGVIFIVVISLIQNDEEKMKALKSINIFIFISNLISFTQYFNLFNLNVKYIKYVAPTQQVPLMPGYTWPRVVGISDNPNVYSYIVVVGIIVSMALFLHTRKKIYLLSTVTNLVALLMTRSRTGFVMFGVSILVFVALYLVQDILKGQMDIKDKGKWVAGIGAVAVFAVLIFIFILPESITWRIKEIFTLSSTNSWQARLKNWDEYLQYFIKHPVLGVGSVKSIQYVRHPDNEWLLLLKRYGLVGATYFMLMFIIPIALNWNRLKRDIIGKIFIAITIGTFVYMIPAIAFHSFQLMSIMMILAALALVNPKKKVDNINN